MTNHLILSNIIYLPSQYINNMQFGPYEVSFISAIRLCDPGFILFKT